MLSKLQPSMCLLVKQLYALDTVANSAPNVIPNSESIRSHAKNNRNIDEQIFENKEDGLPFLFSSILPVTPEAFLSLLFNLLTPETQIL